jgi:hypothetical protein
MVAGPHGVGWGGRHHFRGHHFGYHRPVYAAPYAYPAYAPGYGYGYGAYAPGYYDGPYYYHRRRSYSGAALAAGLIGGITLGAILASATARHSHRCYVTSQRFASASGGTHIHRVRRCR